MWLKIATVVAELLIKFGLKKKSDADKSKADALEKKLDSVDESLDVEKNIRDKQKDVDKEGEKIETTDGGLNFDEFNEAKDGQEDKTTDSE